jgi:hypothetical protein
MQIEYLGDGEPELAVIGITHGDEPCGREALDYLRTREYELQGCVAIIYANERSAERCERSTDTDLNRAYPGDLNSESYESRIASIIMDVTESLPVYDLHSTKIPTPSGEPFAIFAKKSQAVVEMVRQTGVDRVLYFEFDDGSGLHHLPSVEVEHTPKGSEKAAIQAKSTLDRILTAHDLLSGNAGESDPMVYSVYENIEKDGEWDITATNWETVKKGEEIAMTDSGPKHASEEFIPVLFSEDYDDILGYKASDPKPLSTFVEAES